MSKIMIQLGAFTDSSNPKDYLDQSNMTEDVTWATVSEILATTNLLGKDIYVYSNYGNSMKWMNHPTSLSLTCRILQIVICILNM